MTEKMRKIISIITLSMFAATTSFAADLCHTGLTPDDLIGVYTIDLGPGAMTVVTGKGDERVHDAAVMAGTATIALYDGVPILYSDDLVPGGVLEIPLLFAESGEKDNSFLDDPTIPTVGSDDTAVFMDCESFTDLPQIIGTGTLTANGVVITNSIQLVVYSHGDDGISAVGVYDSTVIPDASGGKIVFHVRFLITST
ncbi:MAG: hypothetical protein V3U96_03835 [Paracoccaceae bacterium]